MANLWLLIRDCMHDIERRNNIKFGDTAWQDFKQLEEDIYELFRDQSDIGHYVSKSCPQCIGTGKVLKGDGLIVCPTCQGDKVVFVDNRIETGACTHQYAYMRGNNLTCAQCGAVIQVTNPCEIE